MYMHIKGQDLSDSTFSNFFFLETAWLIEAKFYVEPLWNKSLIKWSRSHDQDGIHVHIW